MSLEITILREIGHENSKYCIILFIQVTLDAQTHGQKANRRLPKAKRERMWSSYLMDTELQRAEGCACLLALGCFAVAPSNTGPCMCQEKCFPTKPHPSPRNSVLQATDILETGSGDSLAAHDCTY